MIKTKNNRRAGFTIIEVVLVLAVAGLIFLVVFAAIPRLQASRRDNSRKSDLRLFMAELENFRSNTGDSRTTTGTYTAAVYDLKYPFVWSTGASSTMGILDFCQEYMFIGLGVAGDHNWKDPSSGTGYACRWSGAVPTAAGQINYAWNRVCSGGETVAASPTDYNLIAAAIYLERGTYCLEAGP